MGVKVNLKNVRVAWLKVFEKDQPKDPKIKPAYRMDVILDKDDTQLQKLDDAALEVMTETLKSEKAAEKWMDKNYGEGNIDNNCAVKDGDERDNVDENYEGKIYVSAKSFKQPRILSSEGEECREPEETIEGDPVEGKLPYGGCYCNVSIELWGQNNDKGKGLRANILGLKFVKDGEAFGGGGSSERATDDDLDGDDDEPRGKKSRRSRDEDDEPRKSRRSRDEDDNAEEEEENDRRSRRRR